MSELFKALNDFKKTAKKHTVVVDAQEFEVTLQQKIEMIKHGTDRYTVKNGVIVLKPKPKYGVSYPVLKKSGKGYRFHKGDIHWPEEVVVGGESWETE